MSFFQNAHNTVVNGAMHAAAGDQHIHYHSPSLPKVHSAFDLLLQHYSTTALFDSIAQSDPPKCLPGTRTAFIDEVISWVTGQTQSGSILWVKGPAGVGKTALLYTIAELCEKKGLFVGGFAFSRSGVGDGNLLIPTLAVQLASAIPSTKPEIERNITQNPSIFERSREKQLQLLIINPLKRLSIRQRLLDSSGIKLHPRIIAIDGLDECSDREVQCSILKIIGDAAVDLKLPIRFLIASRPEAHINRTFEYLQSILEPRISHIYLGEDADATRDLQKYFETKFQEVRHMHTEMPNTWPGSAVVSKLVEKASGQFIYASTVMAFISSPYHRPGERLWVILGSSIRSLEGADNPLAPLDALYCHILSSAKPAVFQILGCLILPEDCTGNSRSFTTPINLEKFLGFGRGDIRRLLIDLQSVLVIDDDDKPIKLLHASLGDFLLDQSRSKEYFINLSRICKLLAKGCINFLMTLNSGEFHFRDIENYLIPAVSLCNKVKLSVDLYAAIEDLDITGAFFSTMGSIPYEWGPASRTMSNILEFYLRMDYEKSQHLFSWYHCMCNEFWKAYTCNFRPFYDHSHISSHDVFIILWGGWEYLTHILGSLSQRKVTLPEHPVSGQVRFTRDMKDPSIILVLVPVDLNIPMENDADRLKSAVKASPLDQWLSSKYHVKMVHWMVCNGILSNWNKTTLTNLEAWEHLWSHSWESQRPWEIDMSDEESETSQGFEIVDIPL